MRARPSVPVDRSRYFLVLFSLGLSLLAFAPLSMTLKLDIFFFGSILPLGFLFWGNSGPGKKKVPEAELLGAGSWTWMGILATLWLGFRVWEYLKGWTWPSADESIFTSEALLLGQKDGWALLQHLGQLQPFWAWLAGKLLALTHSPALSLWLPLALVYLATPCMGYAACRRFFGSSLSLLFAFLLAFSYWPLLDSHSSFPEVLIPLWVLSCFWALGRYQGRHDHPVLDAFGLGVLLGLGPFIFFSWLPVAFWVVGYLVLRTPGLSRRHADMISFMIGWGTMLAFFFGTVGEHFEGRMKAIQGFEHGWVDQLWVMFNYVSIFFGGTFGGLPVYKLWNGGLLNPLLGAFFFLGLWEILKRYSWRSLLAWLIALGLGLGPGLLSNTVDTFRVVQMMPPVLFLTALGIQGTFSRWKGRSWKNAALPVLLLFSFGLDAARVESPYWDLPAHPGRFAQVGATYEKYQAFTLISGIVREKGPGSILSDWGPSNADQSLAFMTFPWNTALNRALKDTPVQWACVICPAHYAPFLSKRFPGSHLYSLGSQIEGRPSSDMLGVFPLGGTTTAALASWTAVYRDLQTINMEDLCMANGIPRRVPLQHLLDLYRTLSDDPFLQSCYFERLLNLYSFEKTFYSEEGGGELAPLRSVLEQAFRKSYRDRILEEKFRTFQASERPR